MGVCLAFLVVGIGKKRLVMGTCCSLVVVNDGVLVCHGSVLSWFCFVITVVVVVWWENVEHNLENAAATNQMLYRSVLFCLLVFINIYMYVFIKKEERRNSYIPK